MKRFLAVALLSICVAPLTAAASAPLTITDYISMPALSAVHFSPDGTRIAYVVTRPNFTRASYDGEIHIIDVDGTNDIALTRSDTATNDHPRWSPDGKSIAFLSDRGARIGIYTIRVDGGEALPLTEEPTAIRNFEWAPDGRTIVFIRPDDVTPDDKRRAKEKDDAHVVGENTRYSRLYAVDVESHRVRRITEGDYSVWSFSISPDSRTIAFDRSSGTGLDDQYRTDIDLMPMSGGEPRPLVTRPGLDHRPLFSPDGNWIAFTSTGGASDWLHQNQLYVVSVADGRPRLISAAYDRSPGGYFWSADSRSLVFDGAWNTTGEIFRVNADGSGFTDISKAGGVISDTDLDGAHDQVAFVSQTVTQPPELYVSSLSRFSPRRVTNINAAYRDRALGETRLIRWKNPKDGLEIEGLLTLPVGYTPGKRVPLLTFVHGGPASHFDQALLGYLSYIYPVQVFAADGYAVLRPNPRGTGSYGEKFAAANRNDWGAWIGRTSMPASTKSSPTASPIRSAWVSWAGATADS